VKLGDSPLKCVRASSETSYLPCFRVFRGSFFHETASPQRAGQFAPVQTAYKPSAVFIAKLRKLGLREEIIGCGPSKEKWEEWNQMTREIDKGARPP
jgi:hypothetical protein